MSLVAKDMCCQLEILSPLIRVSTQSLAVGRTHNEFRLLLDPNKYDVPEPVR